MPDPAALQGFVEKWLAREPEMAVCEVFCPRQQRALFRAWGALSAELADCMFELADANVARTKLAWWGDDLAAGVNGRHPLTRAIFASPAAARTQPEQWRTLALSAIELTDSGNAPATLEAALAELQPIAAAVSDLEAALFLVPENPCAQALHFQLERSLRAWLGAWPDRARIPLNMRDASGAADLRRYAAALLAAWPSDLSGGLITVFRSYVGRVRVRCLVRHADPARALPIRAWRAVLLAWRAARLSARPRVPAPFRD